MPWYEIMFIASMDASATHVTNLIKKCGGKLMERGGTLRRVDHLGLRPLAYRIRAPYTKKWHDAGRYIRLGIQASPEVKKEFEETLKYDPEVVRHLTLKHKDVAPVNEYVPAAWNRRKPYDPALMAYLARDSDLDYFTAKTLLEKGKITPEEIEKLKSKYLEAEEENFSDEDDEQYRHKLIRGVEAEERRVFGKEGIQRDEDIPRQQWMKDVEKKVDEMAKHKKFGDYKDE